MMGETAGNATRGRGEDAWRLEPEGETEVVETKVVSDGVGGVHVDLNGECHQERSEGKVKRQEKKVKKLKARREKIIRVESEGTQDYVREANGLNKEEAEEMSFVPSAICVPKKPLFRCEKSV